MMKKEKSSRGTKRYIGYNTGQSMACLKYCKELNVPPKCLD
jgi:hypothetical protein